MRRRIKELWANSLGEEFETTAEGLSFYGSTKIAASDVTLK